MTVRTSEDRTEVLKTDKRGRVRSSAAQRAAALAEFDRSGLSGIKFAAMARINYQTFASWLCKRRRAGQEPAPVDAQAGLPASAMHKPVRWVEAVVDSAIKCPLCIELPGGVRMEIGNSAHVPLAAQLLKALQGKEGWSC
jgi:hypothetical protein